MRRNVASQVVTAQLNALADGTPVTTGTTTVTVVKDGIGAASTGAISHVNGGLWRYLPTQAETDAEHLAYVFTNVLAGTQTPQMYTEVDVNLLKINSAALPVNNLELQYNTVGLIGDTFPASQAQLGNITTGSGGISALSTGVTITDGTETGAYTDTFALDGTYHSFSPAITDVDFYYETDIGTNTIATSILWEGYVQSNNDILNVFAWDWVSTSWVQVDTIIASNGIAPISETFVLTNTMTGIGVDAGKVRLRFQSSTVTTVATDRVLFEYTAIAESAFVLRSGIAQGGGNNSIALDIGASNNDASYIHSRVITTSGTGAEQESIITDYNGTTKVATVEHTWVVNPDNTTGFNITPAQVHAATSAGGYENASVFVDVSGGTAGTQIGVNGTSERPSLLLSDARVIADKLGLSKFTFDRGLGLPVLDQDYIGWRFEVRSSTAFDLNDKDVSGSVFIKTFIVGSAAPTATATVVFETCSLSGTSLPRSSWLDCGLNGTITLSEQETYNGTNIWEGRPGDPPTINFAGDNITMTRLRASYSGTMTISNMTSVDELIITGNCLITLDASCVGGSVTALGDVKIIDNSTVSPTFITGIAKDTLDAVGNLNDFDHTTEQVVASNMRGTDNTLLAASYTAPDNASITSILTDTNELQLNQNNWLTATSVNVVAVLGTTLTESTTSNIADNLSTFFDNVDSITTKVVDDVGTAISGGGEFTEPEKAILLGIDPKVDAILVDTSELQTNQGNWVTATGFSTFNPAVDVVAHVTLVDTVTNVTNNTDLSTVLANQDTINTNVLSRLADVDYTAPNNAGITSIESKVDAVLVDTGTDIPTLIAALQDLSAAEVKAEIVAALSADVTIEPTSVPASTAPIADKLSYLFAFGANKLTQTASLQTLRNTGDTLDISTAPITTNGVTTTRGSHT